MLFAVNSVIKEGVTRGFIISFIAVPDKDDITRTKYQNLLGEDNADLNAFMRTREGKNETVRIDRPDGVSADIIDVGSQLVPKIPCLQSDVSVSAGPCSKTSFSVSY